MNNILSSLSTPIWLLGLNSEPRTTKPRKTGKKKPAGKGKKKKTFGKNKK